MESWARIIVEWINCLGVSETVISDLQQLQDDSTYYSKIIGQLRCADNKTNDLNTFIKDEYPDFILTKDDDINEFSEQVLLASLLLMSTSQNEAFHKPMFTLKNETQILVKRFLELVLPYSRNITSDTLHATILELDDSTPASPPHTPKDRPLRNFLTSPAAQSAYRTRIMNEQNREVRMLKAQLETERFEKADLHEDIKILKDKLATYQKTLKSKCEELAVTRAERTLAATPQSTKKTNRRENIEEHLRKEVQHLESYNAKLQTELDELRDEYENVSRRLTSKERLSLTLKENADKCEQGMESLAAQLETKSNELLDLRMQNEELRAYLLATQKNPIDSDQSFELDNISRARSPLTALNVSEAASSIIEIQLREAIEESMKLKGELSNLHDKLDSTLQEFNEIKNQNELLNEKLAALDEVKMALEITEDKMEKRDCQINILQMEKETLQVDLEKSKETMRKLDNKVKATEERRRELESEITNISMELNNLKISLVTTEDTLSQTITTKEVLEMKLKSSEEKITALEKYLSAETSKCIEITRITEEKIQNLEEAVKMNYDAKQRLDEEIKQAALDLQSRSRDIEEKQLTIDTLNTKLIQLDNELTSRISALATAETKLCEFTELQEELQSQLIQERAAGALLTEQNQLLENNLSAAETEKVQLQDQISTLELNIETLEKVKYELDEKCKRSDANFQKANETIQTYRTKLEELNSMVESANSEVCELKNINENLGNNLEASQKTRQGLEEQCQLAAENYQLMNEKNLALCSQIEKLQSEVSVANAEIDELTNIRDNIKNNLEKAQEINRELNETSTVSQLNIQEANAKIQILHSEVQGLMAQLTNANSEMCQLKNIHENLQNRLTQEQENCMKIVTDKACLEHIVGQIELEKCDLAEQISTLKHQLEVQRQKSSELQAKYSERDTNCTEATETIEKLTSKLANVESELDDKIQECLKLNKNHSSLMTQFGEVQENINILSGKKASLENNLLLRDEDEKKLHEKMDAAKFELQNAREAGNKIASDYEILDKKYKDVSLTLECLENKMVQLNSQINEVTEDRDNLLVRVDDTTQKYEDQVAAYQNLQSQIHEVIESKEKIINDYIDRETISNELLISIKQELQEIQNSFDEFKLEATHQENFLKSELDQVTQDKLESEMKANEVIISLQEERASQEADLEAEATALAEKNEELANLETQHLEIKNHLRAQMELQNVENHSLTSNVKDLKNVNEENTKKIEELQQVLKVERQALEESRGKYEGMEADRKKLINICEILMCENPSQNPAALRHILDQSFNDPASAELAEMLNNISKNAELTHLVISDIQKQNESLKNSLAEEKSRSEAALHEQQKSAELIDQINALKMESMKKSEYLASISRKKDNLQALLKQTMTARDELERNLSQQCQNFDVISKEVASTLAGNKSASDEMKQLEAQRAELERLLKSLNDRHSKSLKPVIMVLCRAFLGTEKNFAEVYNTPILKIEEGEEPSVDISDEISILETEIQRNGDMQNDLEMITSKIEELRNASDSYETNLKSGIIKREPSTEEKLQIQLDRLTKEKKDIKDKLDAARVRNAKMEKNMDDLRSELKKIKLENSTISTAESTRLTTLAEQLQKDIDRLQEEKSVLEKRPKEEDFDQRLKEVHNEYGQKLEKLKQKMKQAYNQQVEKLHAEQDKNMSEKVATMHAKMEQQCKKYTDDIAKYKAHISDLSSQLWTVGEKLLSERQEKEKVLQRFDKTQKKLPTINDVDKSLSLPNSSHLKTASLDRDYKREQLDMTTRSSFRTVQVIEEQTTTTRRHSVKSIQAMGNAFNVEDEEGEVFDNVCLADLKQEQCRAIDSAPDFNRISELRMRNSLCRPHLKSSYAAETHFHPLDLTEEDIKSGPITDDTFNDSLSQSLLPGQKAKKKDRTQTSYKRPGPPTPSKNGGRLSLQGNELKSPNSRILRERNSERRATATPKRLKDFFAPSFSRRTDENAPATPKGRRLSNIFRKPRPAEKS